MLKLQNTYPCLVTGLVNGRGLHHVVLRLALGLKGREWIIEFVL
ncbi:hypothetical protein H4W27_002105 [Nesterenkonia lutea]|uniref:Uncharacterized protein n=1 Tax=Nesterenkonia lutea TaxID=272919 RepID=A0ABR9JGC3_9MICC|nr:hypothetical protein [Nesterenkonia lutea]